jgi:flagellar hook-associated protein 1 FlgK
VFNEEMVNDLDQEDLDYISSMQWKDDIDFDGFAQDGSTQEKSSFSEFFQEVRVNISSDKENNDFLKETQTAVVQSLEASYEQLTKVDSDEEMINLIQFQAAYTANAKIITVVDEMLQTLLGIRR